MIAKLTNLVNGATALCHSTTSHPASSYGRPVWVDSDNNAYMQVGATHPLYSVEIVETDTMRKTIGEGIAEALSQRGLKAKEVAELADVSASNLSRIINGQLNATLDTLERILTPLGKRLAVVDI